VSLEGGMVAGGQFPVAGGRGVVDLVDQGAERGATGRRVVGVPAQEGVGPLHE
jgi:hypothetical protein